MPSPKRASVSLSSASRPPHQAPASCSPTSLRSFPREPFYASCSSSLRLSKDQQIPPPWAWWENEAPTARAARRPGSGRLFGLFEDPAKVVGAAVDDRNGDDAGHLVRVFSLHAVDDLREEA